MYTSKLLEDVASCLFSTQHEGGGGYFLTGRGDFPYSGTRKPDGIYIVVGRVLSKPYYFVDGFSIDLTDTQKKLSSRVKEQHYIEITSLHKNINRSEDTSTATFTFCISEYLMGFTLPPVVLIR